MDALGQSFEVDIKGAYDNAGVVRPFLMKSNKMLSIESHQCPLLIEGKPQDLFIRYCLIRPPGLIGGQRVVT